MDRAGLACSLGDAESEGVVRRHCKLNMLILLVAAAAAGRRWAAEACRVAIIREPQQLMVQLCQVQQRELAEEIVVIRHRSSRLGLDHHRGEQEQRLEVAVCEPMLFCRTMMNLKQWRAHMKGERISDCIAMPTIEHGREMGPISKQPFIVQLTIAEEEPSSSVLSRFDGIALCCNGDISIMVRAASRGGAVCCEMLRACRRSACVAPRRRVNAIYVSFGAVLRCAEQERESKRESRRR